MTGPRVRSQSARNTTATTEAPGHAVSRSSQAQVQAQGAQGPLFQRAMAACYSPAHPSTPALHSQPQESPRRSVDCVQCPTRQNALQNPHVVRDAYTLDRQHYQMTRNFFSPNGRPLAPLPVASHGHLDQQRLNTIVLRNTGAGLKNLTLDVLVSVRRPDGSARSYSLDIDVPVATGAR